MNTSAVLTLGTRKFETVSTLPSGALRVAGYLTRWDAIDRDDDRMIRSSFLESIPKFMNAGSQPILYNHDLNVVLGRVESLDETDEGVYLVGVIDFQEPTSQWRPYYGAILSGAVRGLSVGARFERRPRPGGGYDIVNVDVVEASVTATPVLSSTRFEIIERGAPSIETISAEIDRMVTSSAGVDADLALLEAKVLAIRARVLLA
jgi:HK97 family phage prohead protease